MLLSSKKRVLFIRKGATKAEAKNLVWTIKQKYPEIEVSLVVVGEGPGYQDDWGLEGVKSLSLEPLQFQSWCGKDSSWKIVFEELGLLVV